MAFGIGWVDFSQEDRDVVDNVLDNFKEKGVLDELGIGVIRDALADKLFPGMSTIQTRAKYFFVTPIIIYKYFKEEIKDNITDYFAKEENNYLEMMASAYRANENEVHGIMGITTTNAAELHRKPSSIYWNGQRTFKIVKTAHKNVSLNEHLKLLNNKNLKSIKTTKVDDEDIKDDAGAGLSDSVGVDITTDIFNNFDFSKITLTYPEAFYLHQKVNTFADREAQESLFRDILNKKELQDILLSNQDGFNGFYNQTEQLEINQNTRKLMKLAYDFSHLIHGAHIRYNYLIQKQANDKKDAYDKAFKDWLGNIQETAKNIDMDSLKELGKAKAYRFCENWKNAVIAQDINKIDALIINREYECKGIRSRINNPEVESPNDWIGIDNLDYRIYNVAVFIRDIYEGLNAKL